MSRARDRKGTIARSPTTLNLTGAVQSSQASGFSYHREVIYPILPITLDQVYDRAAKYTDKLLARPVFYPEEDVEDALPTAPLINPAAANARAARRAQNAADKRASITVSAVSPNPGGQASSSDETKRGGYDRRRGSAAPGAYEGPGGGGSSRRLGGILSVSEDHRRGSGGYDHGGRKSGFSIASNLPPAIAEDE